MTRGILGVVAATVVAGVLGCGDETGGATGAGGSGGATTTAATGGGGEGGRGIPDIPPLDAIDVVLVIDNSRSMADKQQILASAVPELVHGLLNPQCVDGGGAVVSTPASPLDPCPAGAERQFRVITDLHVGVLSSSLGGHGGDVCDPAVIGPEQNDGGRLLDRGPSGAVPTYDGKGFLAWDPAGTLVPPGTQDLDALAASLTDLVLGAGEAGCGYEATHEAWYRFLVDPEPYATISFEAGITTQNGVDSALLQQRADFLRPTSLLVVGVLSDEDDCSIREYSYYPYLATLGTFTDPFLLPRARQECASDPGDPCCSSCGSQPDSCPDDPTCDINGGTLAPEDDTSNLRCWDNKRRFGIDFLYPIERYQYALSEELIPHPHQVFDGSDTVVGHNAGDDLTGPAMANPLFAPDASGRVRPASRVVLAGIVGVPWQDIARDPNDADQGLKTADELSQPLPGQSFDTWDVILGDFDNYGAPRDPHMIASIDARSGTNPVTGTTLYPPSSADGSDPINGHERTIDARDDLQYACTFPLPVPRDCTVESPCDCNTTTVQDATNPVCSDVEPTLQVATKAYPGLRHLALLKALGSQGVVASICPAEVADTAAPAYGYRPAIRAILERAGALIGPP